MTAGSVRCATGIVDTTEGSGTHEGPRPRVPPHRSRGRGARMALLGRPGRSRGDLRWSTAVAPTRCSGSRRGSSSPPLTSILTAPAPTYSGPTGIVISMFASARSAGRTRRGESNASHPYGTHAREMLPVRPPGVSVLPEVSDVDFRRDRAVPGSRIDLGRNGVDGLTVIDFIRYHILAPVITAYWCLRLRQPLRLVLCDVRVQDIPASTRFGHPIGIVIRSGTQLGERCQIRQNVTIGMRRPSPEPPARIGNDVEIGASATVLGPVTIGDRAVIGAGAVVLQDVPSGCVAVGNPARIVKKGDQLDLVEE